MGDFNDSPELDSYEKQLGLSALETLMGSVFEPDRIFHNVFSHWRTDSELSRKLFSSEFVDPIVCNSRPRKVWLDHILLSPHFRSRQESMSHVVDSSMIYNDTSNAKLASDHFPVACDLAYPMTNKSLGNS
jgi:endonuclease/exonuclease/phosphatase family metal-dependent hydrolase